MCFRQGNFLTSSTIVCVKLVNSDVVTSNAFKKHFLLICHNCEAPIEIKQSWRRDNRSGFRTQSAMRIILMPQCEECISIILLAYCFQSCADFFINVGRCKSIPSSHVTLVVGGSLILQRCNSLFDDNLLTKNGPHCGFGSLNLFFSYHLWSTDMKFVTSFDSKW